MLICLEIRHGLGGSRQYRAECRTILFVSKQIEDSGTVILHSPHKYVFFSMQGSISLFGDIFWHLQILGHMPPVLSVSYFSGRHFPASFAHFDCFSNRRLLKYI